MTNVIYLDPANVVTMHMLRESIKYMQAANDNGKFDSQIRREDAVLRSFFDEVLGRSEAAPATEAA